jgi:hypothetical protein
MIVTVVCDVLGAENNGTTIAAMNLIRSLRARGHTVRVVCPDESRRGREGVWVVPAVNFGPLNGYVRHNGNGCQYAQYCAPHCRTWRAHPQHHQCR